MKITTEQQNAASLYWIYLLKGQINSERLPGKNKQRSDNLIALLEEKLRLDALNNFARENQGWSDIFMETLSYLLKDASTETSINLELHPKGLLEEASEKAGFPKGLFPYRREKMTFDDQGNIFINGKKIDTNELFAIYKPVVEKSATLQ